MPDLPSGSVIFLFTDIEGSTRLWEEHPEAMRDALLQHDDLLRACIEGCGGRVFKTMGDAFCAAFPDTRRAVEAVLAAQEWLPALSLATAGGAQSLKVRMALHAGLAEERDGDYFGQSLNRVARLLAIGHGGQVLLSGAVRELLGDDLPAGASLQDRGSHRLRDLHEPEEVFQLCHPELPADFPPLRSLSTHLNNLPQQVTSFIGREQELAELRALLLGELTRWRVGASHPSSPHHLTTSPPHHLTTSPTRLLTLTGSGGCGKTRLALQASAAALEQFPDGAWLVELAPLTDPSLVPQAVAGVLGLKEESGKSLAATLTDYLRNRHLLLVLDNCEHLLDACAELAEGILRSCPRVWILATSREALGIAGELTYRVPSLTFPDPKRDTTPESLSRYEAVALFIERALFLQPQFAMTDRNAPALASVCCRLDGIPLAIELAAARVRSLTVEDINARLDQRFRLLTGGSRTALPRQQTLRSLIDWSYDLLNDAEKALLCRLSVFSGGWSLEAAEAVCGSDGVVECWSTEDPDRSAPSLAARGAGTRSITPSLQADEILDLLTSLCDKSLVVAEASSSSVRYRLLETVRQYARDRLLESNEGETWRDRHLAFFLALAEEAEPHLTGPEQAAWIDRLEAEHDNLRSALEWSTGGADDPERGLRLTGVLWRFWEIRGYLGEGRDRLSALLAADADRQARSVRAKSLHGAGVLAFRQGDYPAARALYEESLAISRELGDRWGIARSLNNLGNVAYDQSDYAAAMSLHEESLALRREIGDRLGIGNSAHNLGNVAYDQGDYPAARALFEESLAIGWELGDRRGIAYSLDNLGVVAHEEGDRAAARAHFEEGLAIFRELGDRHGIADSLNNLGNVACDQGDYATARALLVQSLAIRRELGDRQGVADSLEGIAAVAAAFGEVVPAARIWGAAGRLRGEMGSPLPPNRRARYDRQVAGARAAMGDDAAFGADWAEGRALTLEQAMALALEETDA